MWCWCCSSVEAVDEQSHAVWLAGAGVAGVDLGDKAVAIHPERDGGGVAPAVVPLDRFVQHLLLL